jgi:hypothetical protein
MRTLFLDQQHFDSTRGDSTMIGGRQAPDKEGIWLGRANLDTTQNNLFPTPANEGR